MNRFDINCPYRLHPRWSRMKGICRNTGRGFRFERGSSRGGLANEGAIGIFYRMEIDILKERIAILERVIEDFKER